MNWIPVALSDDIMAGDVAPIRHDGHHIVIWRDSCGRLHAAEDRCPHRGVRLSLGFQREGRIACLYHGWQFDGDGRCRHIPAHPTLNPPSTIALQNFPVMDRSEIVWIAIGVALPDHAVIQPSPDSGTWHGVRSLAIRASVDEARHALTIESGYWRISDSRFLAFHVPCDGVVMVHLALRERDRIGAGLVWLHGLRETLEGIKC